jgi:serine/threonine protein kinase
MELLRGESLGDRLSREKKLEPEVVARIFTEMGLAIARAHKSGIVHRDLKPDNVFLAEVEADDAGSGAGAWTVKVVDFGVAKLMDESLPGEVSTSTGTMIGTPHYMSPEQARGLKPIDARADGWSMAVIAYQCLLGERPLPGRVAGGPRAQDLRRPPRRFPRRSGAVPEGFDAWFARATRRKLDERFQDVSDLVRSLVEVLTPGVEPRLSLSPSAERPAAVTAASAALEATVQVEGGGGADARAGASARPLEQGARHRPWAVGLALVLAVGVIAAVIVGVAWAL